MTLPPEDKKRSISPWAWVALMILLAVMAALALFPNSAASLS